MLATWATSFAVSIVTWEGMYLPKTTGLTTTTSRRCVGDEIDLEDARDLGVDASVVEDSLPAFFIGVVNLASSVFRLKSGL